ncbi:MAG: hypothetical protein ACKO7W_11605 [Elainella sp.]
MIHHISLSAQEPLRVAQVLAELWNGQLTPFPPHPGSYAVFSLDQVGSLIEVYPLGTELRPGAADQQVNFSQVDLPDRQIPLRTASPVSPYSASHAAISVPVSRDRIFEIAARENWRAVHCNRDGAFEVIEFWVENRLLLELLPPDLAPKYLAFMQPQSLQRLMAQV